MVAGGIQIQTGHLIENFLFRIFETCFQSFYKVFVFLENFFQDFVNFYFCPLAPVIVETLPIMVMRAAQT